MSSKEVEAFSYLWTCFILKDNILNVNEGFDIISTVELALNKFEINKNKRCLAINEIAMTSISHGSTIY